MKWLYAGLAALAIVLVAAGTALGWLVGTEAGLQWAAARAAEKLSVENLRGRLAGEISADKVVFSDEGLRVEARQLVLRPHLAALLGGRLTIEPLRAASLEIDLREGGDTAATAPRLALRLHMAQARVDEIVVRRGAARYVVREVDLAHAILGETLSVSGSLYWPDERFATRAQLELSGSLERIDANVSAAVAGVPAEAQPSRPRPPPAARSPARLRRRTARPVRSTPGGCR
jgi:hypothetical protein